VAAAFIGPCPPGHVVNHKDFDRSNNHASNLEYLEREENLRYSWRAGRYANAIENGRSKYQETIQARYDRQLASIPAAYIEEYGTPSFGKSKSDKQ